MFETLNTFIGIARSIQLPTVVVDTTVRIKGTLLRITVDAERARDDAYYQGGVLPYHIAITATDHLGRHANQFAAILRPIHN